MKRLLIVALLSAVVLPVVSPASHARPRQTAPVKRRSVLDYYFLLPYIGIGPSTQNERRDMLQPQRKPVIDLRHDYLRVEPDSSPTAQIAVFRGGADVVAYSQPDFHTDYNHFALYRLQNGKLRDVTEQLLPVSLRQDRFLLELPRIGTTIRVFSFNFETRSRKPAFNLLWRRGRFVVAPLKRARGQKSN